MVFSINVLQRYAMSCVNRPVSPTYSITVQGYQIQSETPMVQQGSQLSEWTEGLRTLKCFGNYRKVYNYLSGKQV